MRGRRSAVARALGAAVLAVCVAGSPARGAEAAPAGEATPAPDGGTSTAPGGTGAADGAAGRAEAPGSPDAGVLEAAGAPDAGTVTAAAPEGDVPRRTPPDYEGRGPPPTTAGDVLVWVPRVILLPPFLVTEYLVAKPVGWLATTAERNNWGQWLFDVFAFGPDHQGGLFPTFLVDFGSRPSVGLHFFWNNTFVEKNRFTADAAYGGAQWIAVSVGDRYEAKDGSVYTLQARWNRRPDTLFYGIGPRVLDTFRSRVGNDLVDGTFGYQKTFGRLQLDSSARIQRTVFRRYSCCGDPSIQQRVEAGNFPAPPGYEQNTTAALVHARAVLDTRPSGRLPQNGVRLALDLEPGVDVGRGFDRSWLSYAGAVEGAWDVTGKARVVTLGVVAYFVDPLGNAPVPWTELVTLGGTEPFPGYLAGRLRDRSAIVARLAWHWPVFAFLDGIAAVAFGNVFGAHLQDFSPSLLRLSAELGMETRGTGTSAFEFVLGTGTETFRDGLRLTSFRLAFGVRYGL